MMTVHAAKGLEFPVVFVLSVAPRRFPHSEQKPVIEFPDELRKGPEPPANIHQQEERRLFFVAMTRAKERLYVSSVAKPGKKPSEVRGRFAFESRGRARDVEQIQIPEIRPAAGAAAARGCLLGASAARRNSAGICSASPRSAPAVYPAHGRLGGQPPALAPDEKLQLSATAIEDVSGLSPEIQIQPLLKIPTGPQAALTFGNIMHQACATTSSCGGRPAALRTIEEFFQRAWKDVGFEDAYQEQAYRKAGLEQLRAFVERQKENQVPARNPAGGNLPPRSGRGGAGGAGGPDRSPRAARRSGGRAD